MSDKCLEHVSEKQSLLILDKKHEPSSKCRDLPLGLNVPRCLHRVLS